jgi:leader peptidase (prepilin peptidase)/N-methyltransferase
MLFLLGACIGSFLNVCIYRLPLEKSLLWPDSRCGHCFQPIRWYDNIPLLSYWLLRGRCRTCGYRFSIRYFLIELFTGLCFAALFYLEVINNVHHLPPLVGQAALIAQGMPPSPQAWVVWAFHVVLVCFLLVTTFCDLDKREIPLSITVPGTFVGLMCAVLWPWPWPSAPGQAHMPLGQPWWGQPAASITPGLYPWPVWGPLPDWLPPGSPALGLATGLVGALVGTAMMRVIRFVFGMGLGVEALGLGDADLMMMAGSFLGWQPVVVAFVIGVFAGLFFGIAQLVTRGDNALPFGPALAVGVVATSLGWHWIGPQFQALFFNDFLILLLLGISCFLMLVASYILRVLRMMNHK